MELKDFVQNAITQLVDGVQAAQKSHSDSGAIINPSIKDGKVNYYGNGLASTGAGYYPSQLDFDLAVTVSNESGANAGIKVFGVGVGGEQVSQTSSVSRLQFSISVALPRPSIKPDDGSVV